MLSVIQQVLNVRVCDLLMRCNVRVGLFCSTNNRAA